jgi:hypothetical protein
MPGTAKIWWHDGATKDVRYNELPIVNEPELGFETLAVGATPASTGAAPEDAVVAIVECDVDLRYQVRHPGDTQPADPVNSKPMGATGFGTDSIGVCAGCTISFVEV